MKYDSSFLRIKRILSVKAANDILASPLCIRATHYNFMEKKYIARLRYLKTNPWRLVTSTDPDEMVEIERPNSNELISLDELCSFVVKSKFKEPTVECVIFASDTCDLVSEVVDNGKAIYYTKNINEAMRTTFTKAMELIMGMKCSDESRAAMKILQVPFQEMNHEVF
ncbi:hypothetical protein A7M79_00430 [Acinetobacter baumannii]|uniref:hypothetical protein n=1 Tax=Acinetobacter baumannii TaxID=470 RepID=UPI0008DCB9A6|nr:hypothetical protein [Acinetobacter baumannii]OIH11990.1 hypothetical protein A7M79_00430 [Acinetobacter baumannii]